VEQKVVGVPQPPRERIEKARMNEVAAVLAILNASWCSQNYYI